LSNLSYVIKRDRKDSKGSNIGYRNGLYLNRGLPNKNFWYTEDIEERNNQLVNEALELFAITEKESVQ
ncbi:DUF262 domain-containing protein, partial [Chloroflexota bacterium]